MNTYSKLKVQSKQSVRFTHNNMKKTFAMQYSFRVTTA